MSPKSVLISGLLLIVPGVSSPGELPRPAMALADRVVVKKAERKLYLYRGENVLREMKVALGLVPEGDKEREGDFRTPEGSYYLAERNVDSDYFLSIRISYPDPRDVAAARSKGNDPGGQIMIHGRPNTPRYSQDYYSRTDWTDGCIAVSDSDMVDIWLMTSANTPVVIEP
jgi:murein L,D-transpeptidase YafK